MFNVSYIDVGLFLLFLIWGIGTLRAVLFWLYLWQLKDYHIGRFIDHFRTSKGKKAIVNITVAVKILLLIWLSCAYMFNDWGYLIWGAPAFFLVYAIESYRMIVGFVRGTIHKPVFTKKITILFFVIVVGMITFFSISSLMGWDFSMLLLGFDICVPIIVTIVVLFFQPFFVMARNKILKKAAKKIATFKNVTVIGITGSYGKTSTKEFLTTILSSKFNVLSTPEHKNSEIGIAQTILDSLNEKHQIFIVEMGSYNKGGIKLLCDMVKPKIGIVTGVNEQHLATFGSMEKLLSAEGGIELVKALSRWRSHRGSSMKSGPKNGTIILNGDNAYCVDLYKKIYSLAGGSLVKKTYTISKNKIDSDIWTEDVNSEKNQISFVALTKEREMAPFSVNVLGRQNVQNLLGAILAAKEFGMSLGEISAACKKIMPQQAGMTLATGAYGINIIDSSYSSNKDGVMADLDYLNIFSGKKVIVMPCLIELGSKSVQIHEQIGKKIAKVCDLAIITTKDQFKVLKKSAMENGMKEENILLLDKPTEILSHITTFCKEGDAVLLEGRVPGGLIKLLHGKQI